MSDSKLRDTIPYVIMIKRMILKLVSLTDAKDWSWKACHLISDTSDTPSFSLRSPLIHREQSKTKQEHCSYLNLQAWMARAYEPSGWTCNRRFNRRGCIRKACLSMFWIIVSHLFDHCLSLCRVSSRKLGVQTQLAGVFNPFHCAYELYT